MVIVIQVSLSLFEKINSFLTTLFYYKELLFCYSWCNDSVLPLLHLVPEALVVRPSESVVSLGSALFQPLSTTATVSLRQL